jgi:hypothetical protein
MADAMFLVACPVYVIPGFVDFLVAVFRTCRMMGGSLYTLLYYARLALTDQQSMVSANRPSQ